MTISVVIADDQVLVRAGFRVLVNTAPDLQVVGEAGTGQEAAEVVRRERPDVVLMDIRMPKMDGIEATRQIIASAPGPRVMILTTFDLDEYVFAALRAGASGLSNTEIAERLQLTVATVKSHVGRLLMKLQARDRAQLVIAAYETGLAP